MEWVKIFFGYLLIDALCRGVDWCRFEGGRGGRKKSRVGRNICKVVLIDALRRGWIGGGERGGRGLGVGRGFGGGGQRVWGSGQRVWTDGERPLIGGR